MAQLIDVISFLFLLLAGIFDDVYNMSTNGYVRGIFGGASQLLNLIVLISFFYIVLEDLFPKKSSPFTFWFIFVVACYSALDYGIIVDFISQLV